MEEGVWGVEGGELHVGLESLRLVDVASSNAFEEERKVGGGSAAAGVEQVYGLAKLALGFHLQWIWDGERRLCGCFRPKVHK